MSRALKILYRSNPVLAITGWAHWALVAVLVVLLATDSRTILGINAWIKPIKFSTSIAIYAWTLAWYLRYLTGSARAVRIVSWGVAVTMFTEIALITMQAARGKTSHFNASSAFNGAVFGIMGVMIALNTVLVVWVLVLFLRNRPEIADSYLWGIRLGLLLFLVAGVEGGMMVAHNGHTVGAPDGGPGLPFVNWSTQHGDLRVMHFVGMHALQVLPLIGWLLSRGEGARRTQVAYTIACGGVYLALMYYLGWMAFEGHPLLSA